MVMHGAVQGVGFRPFVYRLATSLKLHGWVSNTVQGLFIEVEGTRSELQEFLIRLDREKPPLAVVQSLEYSFLDALGFTEFAIRESSNAGTKTAFVLPDIATCPDCLREIFDPADRRFRYPFTNCTNCGPRFTIVEQLPYDRANTSMKTFKMCSDCQREYDDPRDRRFHAQPNACPACGPHLELWDVGGGCLMRGYDALQRAVEEIRRGAIVAVKGLGGFHLIVDACNDDAVRLLRKRKHREEKPFALMYPNLETVKHHCFVWDLEERLLHSPESPIVLLSRKNADEISERKDPNSKFTIASSVAPSNPYLGIMLPYTPLHHLLINELGYPVVATSGNLSDEPICTDEREVLIRLKNIADCFLIHNRPIVRHVDDSIVRVMLGRELLLRRARGYAPLPISIKIGKSRTENEEGRIEKPVSDSEEPGSRIQDPTSRPTTSGTHPSILAVGAHLKNTIATNAGKNVFISQHIGDLETAESLNAFRTVISDFQRLYSIKPAVVVCDLHPDYVSTKHANQMQLPVYEVQHHFAHVLSCMAENEIDDPVLGVSWDGTGYGTDGTIWGGEFLHVAGSTFERVAALRSFKLPGGEKAIKEPRRTAIGALYEIFGEQLFQRKNLQPLTTLSDDERRLFHQMLVKEINSPVTSSVGRLFDAVASIIGLRHFVRFESQAAMELEFNTAGMQNDERYEFSICDSSPSDRRDQFTNDESPNTCKSKIENGKSLFEIDWRPMLTEIIGDVWRGCSHSIIATKFHNTLVEMIISVADRIQCPRVVLSGGCFQNRYLTERAVRRLTDEGFRPYWHQRVPPNDGGIALGQVYAYLRQMRLAPAGNAS